MSIFLSIGAIIFCIILAQKVSRLEKLLKGEEKVIPSAIKSKAIKSLDLDDLQADNVQEEIAIPLEEQKPSAFVSWIVTDWPMKLGAFLILLGFGWLVSYAFMNNWIGPKGRITLGLVAGLGILLLGEWRIKSFKNQGSVFLALGSAVILLTVFAAREIYDFFTPLTALLLMAMVVVFIAISSIKNKSLPLAILSVALGGIAPLLTNSSPDAFGLFSYLFLLSAGTLWVVGATGWRVLSPISLGLVAVYSFPYLMGGVENVMIALFFVLLYTLLYYAVSLATIISTKESTKSDLIVIGASGLLLLVWINDLVSDEWKSLVTVGIALFFVLGAFIVFKTTKLKEPMYVYSGISVIMLAAATAFELSGNALTIAYTIEVGIISYLTAYLSKDYRSAQAVSLLFAVPIMLSIESLTARVWQSSVLHSDFFVLLILSIALLFLGIYFYIKRKSEELSRKPELNITIVLFTLCGFYALAIVWLSLHAILTYNFATMISLAIYTIVGIYFYIAGKLRDITAYRITGEILFGLVTIRLLFVEVWGMNITGKIFTFFLIGALFISTAFMRKRD
ncbi:DUF2339 domain-containing protein [Candidatus Falkowbacteria bacterium]|jgi:uncharacterized membrane protein|nr:DUF2339 domain-containing protein [Candidatus Falkowbacteria bacterium]MBT4433487.1 DUF2339 domain-containing protein [Candidatus Falkowbacteria bacterium]